MDLNLFYLSDGSALDTQRTIFMESGRFPTYFVRILRFYYRQTGGRPAASNKLLTYRTFEPHLVAANGWGEGIHEGLQQTLARAQAWLNVTGRHIVLYATHRSR